MVMGKEKTILRDIYEYYATQEKATEMLLEGFRRYLSDGDVLSIYEELDAVEKRADDLRRGLVDELSKGAYFAFLSEDFIELANTMDEIADNSKVVVKLLVESGVSVRALTLLTETRILTFLEAVLKSVRMLGEAIDALRKGKRGPLLEKIRSIELYEEEADGVKDELIKGLFKNRGNIDVLDIVIIKEMIDLSDNVADIAEDAGDILLSVLAKGYR